MHRENRTEMGGFPQISLSSKLRERQVDFGVQLGQMMPDFMSMLKIRRQTNDSAQQGGIGQNFSNFEAFTNHMGILL